MIMLELISFFRPFGTWQFLLAICVIDMLLISFHLAHRDVQDGLFFGSPYGLGLLSNSPLSVHGSGAEGEGIGEGKNSKELELERVQKALADEFDLNRKLQEELRRLDTVDRKRKEILKTLSDDVDELESYIEQLKQFQTNGTDNGMLIT